MVVTLCFDDGYEEVHRIAFPILAQYNIKGTIGIIAGAIDNFYEGYPTMNLSQIIELYNNKWEIASHSVTHPFLTTLTDEEVIKELVDSRDILRGFGFNINVFVVPYGNYNNRIYELVSQYYYSCRPSIWGTNFIPPENKYMLKSKWVMNDSFETIKSWVDDSIANDTWLIIMFHHIDKPEREYNISSENLISLVEYLTNQEVSVLNISEVLSPPVISSPIINPLFLAFAFFALIPILGKFK